MLSYVSASFSSDTIPILGLPLPLLPFIFPSSTSLSMLFPLRMCPNQFFFRLLIVSLKILTSFTLFSTSSFVTRSFQLIPSILLHNHISRLSILLSSAFFIVHVSDAYKATLQTRHLKSLFLQFLGFVLAFWLSVFCYVLRMHSWLVQFEFLFL